MSDIAMLLGRCLLSAIFIQAGISELMNFSGTVDYFASVGVLWPSVTIWLVAALEIFGGIAILAGYCIRIAALLLAVFAVAAASIGHSDWTDIMHFQAFMKDVAIAGGLLYVAANGAGILSLDEMRK
ncbi:DoxX family protein [Rhizobium sp. KVB221]|uniref:DoxX family protein n=1 Tax=Rhizobium setariae TaxID=2801340 RepID=A0A937CK46_9HYPH|nr:DoxX family protein [Rhizobium setariae]MBL0371780.1 DoxX family protein [Rhizobium setariae]